VPISCSGNAANYAPLFEGGGNNTLQLTNVTTNTTGGGAGVAAGQGGVRMSSGAYSGVIAATSSMFLDPTLPLP
jgi:hypothetical protein